MELVSVITPVYNSEKFLKDTIESVISQTYWNWELILVNDKSTDNSEKIIEEYLKKDTRIKYIKNEKNIGPALTRNEALKKAIGKYIAFLDSDDVWLPKKLEVQINEMTKRKSAISYTLFKRMNEDASSFGSTVPAPKRMTYQDSLKNTAMGTSTVVIDRELVGDFEVKNVPCDDFYLWNEILKRGYDAEGIMEVLVYYRVLSNSYSRNKLKYAIKVWKTYQVMDLGLISSIWYFLNYAVRGVIKYRKF